MRNRRWSAPERALRRAWAWLDAHDEDPRVEAAAVVLAVVGGYAGVVIALSL